MQITTRRRNGAARRRHGRLGVLLVLLSLLVAVPEATAQPGPTVNASVSLGPDRVVTFRGAVAPARPTYRVRVQWRVAKHWSRDDKKVAPARRTGRFVLRWQSAKDRRTISIRLVVVDQRAARTVATGRTHRMQLTSAVSFTVPSTTRLVQSRDVVSAASGPGADRATVIVAGARPAPRAGHVAVGPAAGLPDGMFAQVVSVGRRTRGRTRLVLRPAALDQVLDDVRLNVDRAVRPTIIGADGRRISGAPTLDGFACDEPAGILRKPGDLWDTASAFPIELELHNTRVIHRFDSASSSPRRDPYLLFRFTGEAFASVGFQARTAFRCALSSTSRGSRRLHLDLGSIGPVPVGVSLEPALDFEVSAPGKLSFSQRHSFALTVEKRGSGPADIRRAHSQEPLQWADPGARLEGSLFAGGDLALMLGGAAGRPSAQAAIHGAFGPRFELRPTTPGCTVLGGQLVADIETRLARWVKRWKSQATALTTSPAGPERCAGGPGPVPGPAGGPAAFPSRLKASGRNIVDGSNHVLPKLKGFNMHVEPGFTWDQSHFDDIAALGAKINRAVIHWDQFEPARGVVSAAAIESLDLHIARAQAAGIYTMLEIHLNVGRSPSWTSAHPTEMEKYAQYGQTLTQYLADRYGDPASPKYTKAVIGLGLNEPPLEDAALRNGDGSIPYLEDKQRQMIAWLRAPGHAPDWIGFVTVGYAGATPIYDDSRQNPAAADASPTAYDPVGGNVVYDMHDYMMGCENPADHTLSTDPGCDGRQFNGMIHPTYQGGPLIGTDSPVHSYVSTPTRRGQLAAFVKPYKNFVAQASIPLMLGEWGWHNGTAGEEAWITDQKAVWADSGTAIEIHWNYDVAASNPRWAARPGGTWRPSVTAWMRP